MTMIKKIKYNYLDKLFNLFYNDIIVISLLISLLFISYLFTLPAIINNNVLYKGFKLAIFAILISFFVHRIYGNGLTFRIDEKLIFVFITLMIFSGILSGEQLYVNIVEPLIIGFSYLCISSFWIIHKDKKFLIIILYTVFIISILNILLIIIPDINSLAASKSVNEFIVLINNKNNFGIPINPNRFGYSLLIGFLSSTSLFMYYKIKKGYMISILFFLHSCIFIIFILVSRCRNCILSSFIFSIVVLFILFNDIKEIFNKKWFFILLSAIFLIFIAGIIRTGLLDIIIEKTLKTGSSKRIDIWIIFLKDQFNNFDIIKFLFGKGYAAKTNILVLKLTSLHNVILETWGRYGIIASIVFISVITYIMVLGFKNKHYRILAGIVLSFLVYSFFEDMLFFTFFWIEDLFFLFVLYAPLVLNNKNKNSNAVSI